MPGNSRMLYRRVTEKWVAAFAVTVLVIVFTASIESTSALSYRGYKQEMKEQPDDVLIDLIARYGHTMLRAKDELENSKRTVDFGLSRGYSGAQEAKHRMAMAVANFAGGPGRKRRFEGIML
ncbi:diuretic hormone class 2-like [Anopheles albimanus]|uniref:diuretic hormone class 2-like n=1 Tax=Anopheles albimanus TaxID=7167 RepID=UPI0016421576|nr:diuretic hormone class 2-like [Anopheles albimanus]